jgi:hypothetical protein
MQKRKLTLEELQVESFVTSMNDQEKQTVDGGTTAPCATASLVTIISLVGSYIATRLASCLGCPPPPPNTQGANTTCAGVPNCVTLVTAGCPGDGVVEVGVDALP